MVKGSARGDAGGEPPGEPVKPGRSPSQRGKDVMPNVVAPDGQEPGPQRPPPLAEPADELDFSEIRRYSRHLIIPDVAMTGQKRLKNAKVLCIGAGGLGSPVAMYLAAAGVGTIEM